MERTAIPVTTEELCHYGCGCQAKFRNGSGNLMCLPRSNSCPAIKAKNAKALSKAHADGRMRTDFGGRKNVWSKGLTKDTDSRLKKISEDRKGINFCPNRKPHSENTKKKMRESRNRAILEGNFDSSGRKGHRGHYDGIYFHSSWELAFYIWNKYNKIAVDRNNKQIFKYESDGNIYSYIPDFVSNGVYYEIKAYLYSKRDIDKYNQTKDKVVYLFKEDIQPMIDYCVSIYGKEFWRIYDEYAEVC